MSEAAAEEVEEVEEVVEVGFLDLLEDLNYLPFNNPLQPTLLNALSLSLSLSLSPSLFTYLLHLSIYLYFFKSIDLFISYIGTYVIYTYIHMYTFILPFALEVSQRQR